MEKEKRKNLSVDFLEILILKTLEVDKLYTVTLSNVFEKQYFENENIGKVFEFTKKYLEDYKKLPPRNIILDVLNDETLKDLYIEADSVTFDANKDYDFLLDQTNEHLKNQAIKKALLESVDIIESGKNLELIRQKIEKALAKDLKMDLGLNYFNQLAERLTKIFSAVDNNRVPSYFPALDEMISYGFPPLTLSVFVARIHGGKSNLMANMAARQVLRGHTPVILTLEMSEDMFAQRFDSIYSLLDINKMYFGDNKKELTKRLKKIKDVKEKGQLIIKQFPTGAASTKDFRIFLKELVIRDVEPSIVYVDYINLMKPAMIQESGLYSTVKAISEELRALSFEFKIPFVSVSQLNREGTFVGFEELDFNYISESMGVPATADFMSMMGTDEDALIYESEIHNKIVKNRLGGRIGESWKFYYDTRTLKMYDETEMDNWIEDAKITGDERNPYKKKQIIRKGRNK
jgi:replicative DNA helicase